MSTNNKKIYGLILPKKDQQKVEKPKGSGAFNVFGDDSDSDQETVGPSGPPPSKGSMIMRKQAKIDIAKSLQEDPSVYQYDEIYDEMQANKPQTLLKEKQKQQVKDKKPKYIVGLLKASEVRKKEDERRKERQVQKEREAEGAMYADKESFVTSAYKKRMLEMQEEEERERREAALEAMTDVTKQQDMSGFYRYLYRETAGSEVKDEPAGVKAEPAQVKVEAEPRESGGQSQPTVAVKQEPATSESDNGSSDSSSSDEDKGASKKSPPTSKGGSAFTKRSFPANKYRKQRQASSSPESGSGHKQGKENRSLPRNERSRSRSPVNGEGQGYASRPRSHDQRRRRTRSHSSGDGRDDLESSRQTGEEKTEFQDGKNRKDQSSEAKRMKMRGNSQDRLSEKGRDSQVNGTKGRELSESPSPVEDSDVAISDRLKDLRGEVDSSEKENTDVKKKKKKAEKPTDPKERFPHHNSAKDIEEARKRFYQRKIARERQGLSG